MTQIAVQEAGTSAPAFSSSTFDTRYITGLGTIDERMLILIDIEKLMCGSDMALMDTVH